MIMAAATIQHHATKELLFVSTTADPAIA